VLLVGVGTATAQLAHDNDLETMYAAHDPVAAGLQMLASLVLVGAGLVVWYGQERRSVGPAILGAAVAWMAPVWIGWDDAPRLLVSIGAVLAPFLFPCLVDVALGFPDRGSRGTASRALVRAAYLITVAYVVARAAVYDPFLDPECWVNCLNSFFLVQASPGVVPTLEVLWQVSMVALAALLVLLSADRRAGAGSPMVLAWPVVVAASVAAVTQAVRSVVSPGPEDPRREVLQALFVVGGMSLVALAAALGWATWRRERRRASAMARLAEATSEAAGIHSLTAALTQAMGRPDIELAFWVPEAADHVDATGRPLRHASTKDDVSVLRGDTPVALIRTGAAATSVALVAEALGPAARLTLDNERLRAEEMYHLERLQESRARLLTASDLARRALERDLHDGAQQRLLAVMYSLQLAARDARARGHLTQAERLDSTVEQCSTALAELRDLAHGTFPAILDSAGLASALEHLADLSHVVMSIKDRTDRELPAPAAYAAYVAVASAVAASAGDGAGPITVELQTVDGLLIATIHGAPRSEYVRTADRVSALGGRLLMDGAGLRVEIPCG
jgi:signal transduction histidine kinase